MTKDFAKWKQVGTLFFLLCMGLSLTACSTREIRAYYAQKDNYIHASGVVSHIACNEQGDAIYFGFDSLVPEFDDNCFKIVGDNFETVKKNGITKKIQLGDTVSFTTAPRYFGDGYVMPMVAVSIDGEELLGFDEGYANFMKWLEE